MAPAESLDRRLRWWEQICSTMNVSMSFQLDAAVLNEDMMKQAWAACMQEYPYLRCALKPAEPPLPPQQLMFQEQARRVSCGLV